MRAVQHDFDTVSARRRELLRAGLTCSAALMNGVLIGTCKIASGQTARSDAAGASNQWVLSGHVRDAKSATPIAGALVEAWLSRDQRYVTQSDADGRFVLTVCARCNDETIHLLSYRVSHRGFRSVAKAVTDRPELAGASTTIIRDLDGVFRSAVGIALFV